MPDITLSILSDNIKWSSILCQILNLRRSVFVGTGTTKKRCRLTNLSNPQSSFESRKVGLIYQLMYVEDTDHVIGTIMPEYSVHFCENTRVYSSQQFLGMILIGIFPCTLKMYIYRYLYRYEVDNG